MKVARQILEPLDHQADFLGGADGDAQAMRQPVAADLADDDAAGAQERIGRIGFLRRRRNRPARNSPRSARP